MSYVKIDGNNCLQCGACEGDCPEQAISQDPNSGVYVVDIDKCIYPSCDICFNSCPAQAIAVDNSSNNPSDNSYGSSSSNMS